MEGELSLGVGLCGDPCGEIHRRLGEPVVALSFACWQSSHLSNETYSRNWEELGNTSSSPRASVISIPELFTYALYIVIAFVLEVIYIAFTLSCLA